MCEFINVEDDVFGDIIQDIKENNLSRSNMPQLVIGTGLSASYGVPGMKRLGEHLDGRLSKHFDEKIKMIWSEKANDVKTKGLEAGLKSLVPAEQVLGDEIRKITAAYILREEEKLHDAIYQKDSGFAKLLNYLRETCSVNNRILDIMTPNYDRVVEIVCDKLKIKVITGFEGELFQTFNSQTLLKPENFYNTKKYFHVRLFKPHGSINLISKENKEFLTNDFKVLNENSDYIEIITPGSQKYEAGLINSTFRTMREDFNHLISDTTKQHSLFIYGYGFNDSQFDTVLFENSDKNILIIAYEVKNEVLKRAMKNARITVFYQKKNKNYMIYKKQEVQINRSLWDMNEFAEIFLG